MTDEQKTQQPAERPKQPARRPYRAPTVLSRPLFEQMALECYDPGTGDPMEGGPS